MNIGKTIKVCRTQRGYKQEELASLAGVSTSLISLIEKGKREPSLLTLESISKGLSIPLSLMIFLSSEEDELTDINPDLVAKIRNVAFELMLNE